MEVFADFLMGVEDPSQRGRTEEVLAWIASKYPHLKAEIRWNQPMFTDHGTFIIGFSVAKKHLAVAPERAAVTFVKEDLAEAGYDCTKELIRIPWNRPVDYQLLEKIIDFNILDKAAYSAFWRK